MKKTGIIFSILLLAFTTFAQQKTSAGSDITKKIQQDKEAIKSMAGCYKVSFDFAETFSPDTAYKKHHSHHSWGIEYVFVIEETDTKISLQHLLIANDTMIIKHWRQDWLYENTELLSFYKDSEWRKIKLTPEQAKGTWTQKVFQVDDSPRYESYGTWIHVDGRHFWQSVCDAPLPRREFTTRSDYNVLKRHNHYEILKDGWVYEQDNEKILRENGVDKLICWEKGIEKFSTGNYNCQPAIDWWNANQKYWADVRKVWDEIYAKNDSLKLQIKIDDKLLFMELFELGDKYKNSKNYNSTEVIAAIKQIINNHIQTI